MSQSAKAGFPGSSNSSPIGFELPPNSADCHIHVHSPRFQEVDGPVAPPENATVGDYSELQTRMGTSRVVIVQSRFHGTDNGVILDALDQLGDRARGVAVIGPDAPDAMLLDYRTRGVRGIRVSLMRGPLASTLSDDVITPLARRAADLGWHLQLCVEGELLEDMAGVLQDLPCPIVFDHLGLPPFPAGAAHISHRIILKMIDAGKAWVKLSGPYLFGETAPYPQASMVARSFVTAAPERAVWGSDWPHPSPFLEETPDDIRLISLLQEWAPESVVRRQILVENPAKLYQFDRS